MKIYTKTGDSGQTSLFGGGRVSKSAARIEAYGTVDELNSILGMARAHGLTETSDERLEQIQNHLFVLGADLATPVSAKVTLPRIQADHILPLEQWIDAMESELAPLRYFIIPGGNLASATLHLARTVCRRAERRTIAARETEEASDISIDCITYLNRISDLLFVMARYENMRAGVPESKWEVR